MWKKIKAFIPWIISIISTVFITKFFTRRKSSGNEYSRATTEIENELIRNRELTRKANDKINSISDRIGEDETRVKSIENGLSNIEMGLRGNENDSNRIKDLNKEKLRIINELQERYNRDNMQPTNAE